MERFPTWTCVVAALLVDPAGRWLMHRRPPNKAHAGLWEFPGGKVEPGEIPGAALVREMAEELDVTLDEARLEPLGFAQTPAFATGKPLVILLYTTRTWSGIAHSLEGGAVEWFAPADVAGLAKPPLDITLAEHARRLLGTSGERAGKTCDP